VPNTLALAPSSPVVWTSERIFGPLPLLDGEDRGAYNALVTRVSEAVKPADILEEIWVCDYVALAWEINRLRRFKTSLLNASRHQGLKEILEPFLGWEAEGLAKRWAERNPAAIKEVDKVLASAGVTMDGAVMAQTLSLKISDIERMDRLIMNAEVRRNVVLLEIDRHRASLGQALRRASEEPAEAQLEVVGTKQIADRSAA
jgi:hypothetical protein